MTAPAPGPARGKPVSPVSIAQTYYVDQSYAAEDSLQYHLHQTDDLEQIPDRSEMALIATLRSRLQLGVPFTRAGPLMLSVKSPLDPALYFNSSVKATYSSEELSPSLPPHLYSASHSAYASLKSSKQSQAIVLLGHSGSGKTFDLIHLMDHLVTLASTDSLSIEVEADKTLFKLLHSGLQALHIMGSVMSEHNLESTTCGLVVEVKYDAQFRAVGGSIRAKLMDVSLPKPRNGRTYQVLHSLICGNKQLLHGLGLHSSVPFRIFDGNAQPRLKVLDSEAWLRFVDCLNQLSLSKAEYQSFLDVLASVIHVYDVPFVCSSYTPRGSAVPSSHWVPRNRSLIQKICKLLGCTEDVFMETFTGFSSKSEAEERIVDLSRTLFEIAFTWLLEKVNEYLEIHCQSMIEVRTEAALGLQTSEKWSESKIKQEKRSIRSSFQPIYSISLVDFPGFAREETLGTLSKNLGLETLHLYCSSSYVTLLSALASERVRFKYLDSPRCKDIVDLFLGKEVALAANIGLPNSAFATYWRDLVSAAKTDGSLSRAISVSESEEFTLQYTWTSLSFSLEKIRAEAEDQFGPQLNAFFFKKCANVLLVARSNRSPYKETQLSQAKSASLGCYFGERVSNSLAYLMKPLLAISASVIYCLHSTKNEDGDVDFPLHTTVSLFRNSLIRPQIVWKWFGFTSWRTKEELMQLFDGVTARSDEGLRLVLTEILKDEFLITDRMVLMTPRQEGILWEVVDLWSKGTRDAASLRKVISAVNRTRAGPKGKEVLFGFEAPGLEEFGNVHLSSYMKQEYTYEAEGFETFSANLSDDSAAMLQELPRNKHFEKPHKKSSLKTLQAQVNTILLQSRKDFAVISKSLRTPEVIDYTELLPYILRIQAHIRGFLARKYTSVLLTFTRNVVVLQAFWRGFRARQAFKPLLLEHRAAIRIQRRFRQYRGMRIRAAIKIQRWFLKVLTKRYLAARRKKPKARAHWTGKTSVSPARDQVARNLHTGIRSAQRTKPKTPPPHDEYTFTPDISKTSSRLAKNKHNRLGSDRLPFPDRFRMMENERQRKIHQMVQMKLEQEGKDLTLTPKVNRASRSPGSKAGFYERQMERWVKLKRWKDTELIKKDAIAAEELTFIPKVKTSVRTRGIERTIQDLYTWDKLRVKELKRKQDESEQQKLSELREKVDLSPVSQRIIRERKERESISDRTMEDMLTKTLPYWPSHSPQASGVRLKQDTMH